MGVKLMKLELIYGCLGKRFVVRSLFFAMALAAMPVLYVVQDAKPCDLSDYPDDCVLNLAASQWPFHRVSGPKTDDKHFDMKPFYNPRSVGGRGIESLAPSNSQMKIWVTKAWRQKVEFYSAIYSELFEKGLIRPGLKALCVGSGSGHSVLALRENGLSDAIGVDRQSFAPLVRKGDIHRLPFSDNSFDLVFSASFERALVPALFVFEIERTLKPDGLAVMLVSPRRPHMATNSNLVYSLSPIVALFRNSDVVHLAKPGFPPNETVIVLRKRALSFTPIKPIQECSPLKQKRSLIKLAEPLKRNFSRSKVVYLPHIQDIGDHKSFIYVDIGGGNLERSITGWFLPTYPKQNRAFHIYAISTSDESQSQFHGANNLTGVEFVPSGVLNRFKAVGFDANTKNDSRKLSETQGLGIAGWLKQCVSQDDFVVVKMAVGAMEFEHVTEMIESGAICLIDELFLQCRYSSAGKYKKSYGDCLQLFQTLRNRNVFVHQW
eukprot:Gb_40779 [translate_table: standard]